jgi:hypothetical protein
MQESQKNIVDGMEKAFHIVGVIQPTIHMKITAAEINARNSAKHAAAVARYNVRLKAYNRTLALAAKEAALVKELIAIRENETKASA